MGIRWSGPHENAPQPRDVVTHAAMLIAGCIVKAYGCVRRGRRK